MPHSTLVNNAIVEVGSRPPRDGLEDVLEAVKAWSSRVCGGTLEAYGSAVTGITDAVSDLDVSVQPSSGNDVGDPVKILSELNNKVGDLENFSSVKFVPTARVPVLTLERSDGFVVDITVANAHGVHASRLLAEYCEVDERVRKIACAIKSFCRSAGVIGAAKRNLPSYAWSLMTIFYLQVADLSAYTDNVDASWNLLSLQAGAPSKLADSGGRTFEVGFRCKKDVQESGTPLPCAGDQECFSNFPWAALLSGFFDFYLDVLDWSTALISVRLGRMSPATPDGAGLHIEDPLDPEKLLGPLPEDRLQALVLALQWGREALVESPARFAHILQGSDDLRAPVVWETLFNSGDVSHQCVRPAGAVAPAAPPDDMPTPSCAAALGHEVDDFQLRAAWCTERGESVVVAAPTSAGKTVVAECGIHAALAQKTGPQGVMFCAPMKALSNQKFIDFAAKFKGDVGLLTGDVAIARESRVLVVTTEVLRSMLFSGNSLSGVRTIIFDEVHFFGHEERGSVWEGAIVLIPPHINLICLSATIPNCLDIAGWICQTRHAVCHMVLKRTRPTPLQTYGVGTDTKLIVDAGGTFYEQNFESVEPQGGQDDDAALAKMLQRTVVKPGHTPMLVFLFSKAACQNHARSLALAFGNVSLELARMIAQYATDDHVTLNCITVLMSKRFQFSQAEASILAPGAKEKIKQLAEDALSPVAPEDRSLDQVTLLIDKLLPHGVGIHNGGLIAPLRELVERLFAEGLLPVLFCTETCAVGLNLPTKAVAFHFKSKRAFVKCSSVGQRLINPGEYLQMVGRAGRRGLDKCGKVLHCTTQEDTQEDMGGRRVAALEAGRKYRMQIFKAVVLKDAPPVVCKSALPVPTLLNLLRFGHVGYIRWFALQSFDQFQSRSAALSLDRSREIDSMLSVLKRLGLLSDGQRLTPLGQAASRFWIGDALLLSVMLRDGHLDTVSAEEVVVFLATFVAKPRLTKKTDEDELDKDKLDTALPLCAEFLAAAHIVSQELETANLVPNATGYKECLAKGMFNLKGFTRMKKDTEPWVRASSRWMKGESFAQVLESFPRNRRDAGGLATAIRRLAKLVRQVANAARVLDKSALVDALHQAEGVLIRGLPFLESSILRCIPGLQPMVELDPQPMISWPPCPHPAGTVLNMRPSTIGFSHRACSPYFQDGKHTVRSTLYDILSGRQSLHNIEQLRVYWHQGRFYTLGNRRLAVYRLLEQHLIGEDVLVSVRVVSDKEAEEWNWQDKFTSGRWQGSTVLLRHTGDIIGLSRQHTFFDFDRRFDVSDSPHPSLAAADPLASADKFTEAEPGGVGYWQHLRAACSKDAARLEELAEVSQVPWVEATPKNTGPPRPLLDPRSLTDQQLARMNMDWSPCADALFEQPGCDAGNGKPCTRKGCTGIFERTGEPCTFCHHHGPDVIARFEAFRGFARRAAKQNRGTHVNRRMGR